MPEVSLTDFVDFAASTGAKRINKVREIKGLSSAVISSYAIAHLRWR